MKYLILIFALFAVPCSAQTFVVGMVDAKVQQEPVVGSFKMIGGQLHKYVARWEPVQQTRPMDIVPDQPPTVIYEQPKIIYQQVPRATYPTILPQKRILRQCGPFGCN